MGFLAGGGEINIARANSEKGKAASDHSNGYSGVWLIFAIIIICLLAVKKPKRTKRLGPFCEARRFG